MTGVRLMRGFKPVCLGVATLALVAACSGNSSSDGKTMVQAVRTSGVEIRLRPGDAETFSDGEPRYARIKLTPKADLVLDERFDWIVPPDFMSVLPVSRGQGTRRRLGKFEVACMADPPAYYACGVRQVFRGMPFVLLFVTPPQSEAEVAEQVSAADTFLAQRVADA